MPQSLACIPIHCVWGTKYRQPLIQPEIEEELHRYLGGIFREYESPALAINGMADHVHALILLSRKITIASLMEEVKKSSSKWIKTKGEIYQNFYWQGGYGAFGVSKSHIERVKRYIANQKAHHRRKSFEEEYLAFLAKYEVAYDARYLWD